MKKLWVLTAILLLTVAVSAQTTIVTGGVVETATGQKDDATAVVLQNGKIAYVGSDEGAMAYHSGNAEIIDAAGNTIMPTMTEANMYQALSEMASDKELKMKVRSSFWVLPYDFKDWNIALDERNPGLIWRSKTVCNQ